MQIRIQKYAERYTAWIGGVGDVTGGRLHENTLRLGLRLEWPDLDGTDGGACGR